MGPTHLDIRPPTRTSTPGHRFVNLHTSLWFGGGGIVASAINSLPRKAPEAGAKALPEDMSTTSLFGGGLIAGDSLAALGLGIAGLLGTLLAG